MQTIHVDVNPEDYDLFLEANNAVGQLEEEFVEDSDSDNEDFEMQALLSPSSPSGAPTPSPTRETTPNPHPVILDAGPQCNPSKEMDFEDSSFGGLSM